MSLYEDWWITDTGEAHRLDASEHAEMALRVMLLLPDDYVIRGKDLFNGLDNFPKAVITAAKKNGADPLALKYLKEKKDPRLYLLKERGWIRIARNKLNVWSWDDKTLDLLRRSNYWAQQPQVTPYDMFDANELKTNAMFSISVGKVRNPNAEAEALKRMAMGVGQHMNPPGIVKIDVDEYHAEMPARVPGTGTITVDDITVDVTVDERGGIEYDSRIPPYVIAELAKLYV